MSVLAEHGYQVIRLIGQGSFGRVQKVRRVSGDGTERFYACKEINYGTMSEKEKSYLVQEVNILRELRHPAIVRYIDRIICKAQAKIYIIMEYCDGGDLAAVIKNMVKRGTPLREADIWQIFSQLVDALRHLHVRPSTGSIMHRDIKPGNIFLNGPNKSIKLGDFGLARELGRHSVANTMVGTPLYMSPEQISEGSYGTASDIWALGCVLYELASLRPPFTAAHQAALARRIRHGSYPPVPAKHRYSRELTTLIDAMLQQRPSDRPSIDDIYHHPRVLEVVEKLRRPSVAAQPEPQPTAAAEALPPPKSSREDDLDRKERKLKRLEADLHQREKVVRRREAELATREAALEAREKALRTRARRESAPLPSAQFLRDRGGPSLEVRDYGFRHHSKVIHAQKLR